MTRKSCNIKIKKNKSLSFLKNMFGVFIILFAFIYSIFLSPASIKYAKDGLILAATVAIPSLFPFMILTDAIVEFFPYNYNGILGRVFERIFKLPKEALPAFIIGCICGFPTGAKASLTLYEHRKITKAECERLISISNNAGPAFLIGGIGYAMHSSAIFGISIYLAIVFSAAFIGYLLSFRKLPFNESNKLTQNTENTKNAFSITKSINSAAVTSIKIASYIIFFSIISGFTIQLIGKSTESAIILSFLEVTTASKTITSLSLPISKTLALSTFASAFGGLSVYMQTLGIILKSELKIKSYILIRLLIGLVATPISLLIYSFLS